MAYGFYYVRLPAQQRQPQPKGRITSSDVNHKILLQRPKSISPADASTQRAGFPIIVLRCACMLQLLGNGTLKGYSALIDRCRAGVPRHICCSLQRLAMPGLHFHAPPTPIDTSSVPAQKNACCQMTYDCNHHDHCGVKGLAQVVGVEISSMPPGFSPLLAFSSADHMEPVWAARKHPLARTGLVLSWSWLKHPFVVMAGRR